MSYHNNSKNFSGEGTSADAPAIVASNSKNHQQSQQRERAQKLVPENASYLIKQWEPEYSEVLRTPSGDGGIPGPITLQSACDC